MIKYVFTIALFTTGIVAENDRPVAGVNENVRHELVTLSFLDVFDNLAYHVYGDEVVLAGQVTRSTLKTDAERVVRRIQGVRLVHNEIEVLPLSQNDDRLRRWLYHAIYGYSPLNRYALPVPKPIRIIVKNGFVTLEGIVANETDKNLVNMRAHGYGRCAHWGEVGH
jgi:hyperosmotically inducible protein